MPRFVNAAAVDGVDRAEGGGGAVRCADDEAVCGGELIRVWAWSQPACQCVVFDVVFDVVSDVSCYPKI